MEPPRAQRATQGPGPRENLSALAAWILTLAALVAAAPLAPAALAISPLLLAAGPALALVLAVLSIALPGCVSAWSASVWAVMGWLACAVAIVGSGQPIVLGLPAERILVIALGLVYAVAAAYALCCRLLHPPMKAVLVALGAWAIAAVPLAIARQQTLWDMVERRVSPTGLAGAGGPGPYLDPTFVGVNAFLVCVLSSGFFDLFSRLVQRDWRGSGAVLTVVLLLFSGERFLLDRYDARGLPNFRTVVRELVRSPADG
jgi:hypothetical protein